MILFVFEGERDEGIFETIEKLYFSKHIEKVRCVYGTNIYDLYNKMKSSDLKEGFDEDLISILREKGVLDKELNSSDFSEVYLFFDYDWQNKNIELEKINIQLKKI